ncbi:Hypothetical predicted protein [Olea europaea subsp. europaea]|uniref:Uncharacterized protein n=1 Tax=Olea europaea subsp. europaea TaxID=158383 RepID=A0A8S0S821_OLEEU|nr:Hypothetical predicted protein [Olea europaea subsp. europaea]
MRTLEGVMCTERSIDSDPSPEPRCIKHRKRATDAAAAALSSEDQQIKQEVDPTAPTKSTRFLGVGLSPTDSFEVPSNTLSGYSRETTGKFKIQPIAR